MDNDFATGYALGSDSGNGNNSGFGGWGDGLWAIIILAMIWGGNGWGGFGGGSNSPGFQGYATRADVNEAIAFNGVERGISNIQQGICDSTYPFAIYGHQAAPGAAWKLCRGWHFLFHVAFLPPF